MAFPQGVPFRSTTAYVTDISGDSPEYGASNSLDADNIDTTNDYPRSTPQGNTVGWVLNGGNVSTRNRLNTNDSRLAGCNFATDDLPHYQVDLPTAGTYRIRIAAGDPSNSQSIDIDLYDNNTLVGNIINGTTSAANRFFDATGVERTNANWAANNAYYEYTFSSTTLKLKRGGSGLIMLSYLYIEQVSSGAGLSGSAITCGVGAQTPSIAVPL